MSKPRISIIAPVYNVEKYIRNFLISVNNQTFRDFELILINDGSTDNSVKVAMEYLKNANFDYTVINKENGGQSSARNVGILNSKGDWLVFSDSDDVLQSNYLELMYSKIEVYNETDVVICDINRVSDKNIFEESKRSGKFDCKIGKEFFKDFIMHKIEIGPVSLLIRKRILIEKNIFYNEDSRYSEEFIFITDLLYSSNKVIHLKEKLYNYCLRSGSVSTGAQVDKILNGYNQIKEYSKKYSNNINEYEIIYNKYALPRWILATARFTATNLEYNDYLKLMKGLDAKKEIKKMLFFPSLKVVIASFMFEISMKLSYIVFRK